MARPDRLLRLLQAMRVLPAPLTASRLAEEMGVSLRSLYRDIDSLRAAGARIEGERGYGYRLVEDFALPPQTLTHSEIEALVLGLAEVRGMGDKALCAAAASALAKIAATLPDEAEQQVLHAVSRVFRPQRRAALAIDLEALREAAWRERAVDIAYVDQGGAATERRIWPLAIVYTELTLSVLAWCCLRQDFRIFRGDRISRATVTGESFRPRRVSLLRDYLAKLETREGSAPR
jgi:predicted DNA-binding transcriptional regulator YafY